MKRRTKNKKKREWIKDLLKNKLPGWAPKPTKGAAQSKRYTA
ncbi:hypothetical protein [Pseudalkalibacillus salsuginis]|nr:hypothetical protein [Pseudalkalibacillus salsuginis]